ncbi:hypothetical protein CRUP_033312 [Coryphaenoides rupestris]|nr:hypothetical protein CRUP_033312 [Coryphaenoides rupestris]
MFVEERILTLFKRNAHHTLTYWSVFFSFGLCIAFLGPTILDLQCQTGSSLSDITWVFFAQQFCLLIGSSIGGVFKKTLFSALAALFVSASVISLIFSIIPLCNTVLLLAVAMAVSGLAMGVIDTIANIQLVTIYQKDSAVFLQTGCGNNTNATGFTPRMHPVPSHDPNPGHNFTGAEGEGSTVHNAFWIMAGINVPVPLAILFLMYRENLMPCSRRGTNLLDKDELAMENQQGASDTETHEAGGHGNIFSCCQNDNLRGLPVSFFMIHILGGLVLFMTDGIVSPIKMDNRTAGYLVSVFWAAITAGRLVSIPLTYRFQPVRLLLFNLAGVIVTVLLLLIFTTNGIFLFVGTCLCGLFLSSIFPCMVAYTEDILDYQGCATSVLLIYQVGTYSFLVCGMILGCGGFLVFIGLLFFHRMHRNYLTGTTKKSTMVEEPSAAQSGAEQKRTES